MSLTLVIPCYNEAARLQLSAFAAALGEQPALSLLFVNDGSTDTTAALLNAWCAERPKASVLHHEVNKGKAEAVRSGVLQALETAPDVIGFWDADLATPLSELPRFLDVLDEDPTIDLVMGLRLKRLGATVQRGHVRHYLGRLAATAASWVLGLPVYDTQCGAKVFRVTERLRPLFAAPFHSAWLFDVELLARWLQSRPTPKTRLYELPLQRWVNAPDTRITLRAALRAPLNLWTIWRVYRPRRR